MRDDLRRMALFGSGVAELTRHRAEQLAKDLLERSKQNRDDLLNLIRGEIRNQLTAFGVATKRDLERLERRVARLEAGGTRAGTTRSTSTRKSGGRRKTTTPRRSTTTKPARKTDPTSEGS